MSPAKHSNASVTDGRTMDKVLPMSRYASQATQKVKVDSNSDLFVHPSVCHTMLLLVLHVLLEFLVSMKELG